MLLLENYLWNVLLDSYIMCEPMGYNPEGQHKVRPIYYQESSWYNFECVRGIINNLYGNQYESPKWKKFEIGPKATLHILVLYPEAAFSVSYGNSLDFKGLNEGIRRLRLCTIERFEECKKAS